MSYPVNRLTKAVSVQNQRVRPPAGKTGPAGSFKSVFEEKLKETSEVKFSAHAKERLRTRNINFSEDDINRLETGIRQLVQKGSRESLVLIDQAAFVVNVHSRTVITAIGRESLRNNVFTNIDSTVIV